MLSRYRSEYRTEEALTLKDNNVSVIQDTEDNNLSGDEMSKKFHNTSYIVYTRGDRRRDRRRQCYFHFENNFYFNSNSIFLQ